MQCMRKPLRLVSYALFVILLLWKNLGAGLAATSDDVARLHNNLFRNYNRYIPPVYNQSHQVHAKLSLFLLMIHDLDMKNQVLTTSGWINMNWHDEFLRWNKSEYGGVEDIAVSQHMVWLPDILVENTAQSFEELGNAAVLISVNHEGFISWEPGILTKTICEVNIGKYPFDFQTCDIKFLTWMHTNRTLDVMPGAATVDLEPMIPNGEWDVTSTVSESYAYPSTYRPGTAHTGVTFRLKLQRKRTFYVINTIVPVMMLSLLNVLVFLLPASSGEKMALAVTVLLSFTVYLSIISEVMPKTSESISILAVYLTILLSLSTMSVLSSGVVMNMIHQDVDRPVPNRLKCLVCFSRRRRKRRRERGRRLPSPASTSRNVSMRHRFQNGSTRGRRPEETKGHHFDDSGGRFTEEFSNKAFYTEGDGKVHPERKAKLEGDRRECREGGLPVENSPLFEEFEVVDSEEDEITWNDVGSAVDNLLFWSFLIFTLSSTAVVLIMFSF